MKKVYLLSLLFLFSLNLFAQEPFITTWKTTTDNESITIPTEGGGYNYSVDWGDGSSDSGLNGDATHEYDKAGTYIVSVSGDFPRIYFWKNNSDRSKIMTIEQWGDIQWASMAGAFSICENLTYNATDAPDLSNVTSMSYMFFNAFLFNGDLNNWDVSNVKNMSRLFAYNITKENAFNGNISDWDVSSVTNMSSMFDFATSFNSDISKWDVSSVNNMSYMFDFAKSFNQDLSNWDVSNVTSMRGMFEDAYNFNQDLSKWNISSVRRMYFMFDYSGLSLENYDKLLNQWSNLANLSKDITLGARGLATCTSEEARLKLINDFGWTINDDGQNCRFQKIYFEYLGDKPATLSSFKLNVSTNAGLPIVYELSNDHVATIDGDIVKIMNGGQVEITAIARGNENYDRAKDVMRRLWVYRVPQSIKFDSLEPKPYWAENFNLTAFSDSGLEVSYISSNEEVASVSDKEIDLKSEGTTFITATQYGNSIYKPADSVTQELLVVKNTVTSVKDIENSIIQIYPNPTYDFIYINNVDDYKYVRVYNEEGKLVQQQKLESTEVKIQMKNQSEGVYFIRLDNKKEVFKILKN